MDELTFYAVRKAIQKATEGKLDENYAVVMLPAGQIRSLKLRIVKAPDWDKNPGHVEILPYKTQATASKLRGIGSVVKNWVCLTHTFTYDD
mgnify:FL=1